MRKVTQKKQSTKKRSNGKAAPANGQKAGELTSRQRADAERKSDLKAARKVLRKGAPTIPYDVVRKRLGLT